MSSQPSSIKPPIWILALGAGLGPFAVTLVAPAIPALRDDLSAGPNIAQLVLTTLLISIALGQLIAGPLSDRFGRRPLFIFGSLAYAVGGIGASLSHSVTTIIIFRVLQGLGAAASIAMSRSIVLDSYDRDGAARAMSSIIAMMAVIPVLGTSLGGVLTELIGWRGAFLVLACTGGILFFCVHTKIKETHTTRKQTSIKSIILGYSELLRSSHFLAAALTTAFQTGVFFALMGFIAYSFARMNIGPAEFGFWMGTTSLGYVLGNLLNKRLLKIYSIESITFYGSIASILNLALMWGCYNLDPSNPVSLALPMFLVGISNGVIIANSIILASSSIPYLRGSATGLVGALQMTSGGVAGTLAVWLGADQNTNIGIITLIAFGIASSLAALWSYRVQNIHNKRT
ncbi:multidrug effflux MFS transporter [Litorivicinus sp.]|nr:multidrug effflux MFS transporter [Litorivicinus sp.]